MKQHLWLASLCALLPLSSLALAQTRVGSSSFRPTGSSGGFRPPTSSSFRSSGGAIVIPSGSSLGRPSSPISVTPMPGRIPGSSGSVVIPGRPGSGGRIPPQGISPKPGTGNSAKPITGLTPKPQTSTSAKPITGLSPKPGTNGRIGSGSVKPVNKRDLTLQESTVLNGVKPSVDPATSNAIDKALAGRPLSPDQRKLLVQAMKNNPGLSNLQKGALARALQEDMKLKNPSNGGTVIIPSGGVVLPGSGGVVVPAGTVVVDGGVSGVVGGGSTDVTGPVTLGSVSSGSTATEATTSSGSSEAGEGSGSSESEAGLVVREQTQRFLKVANTTAEKLTIQVLYATLVEGEEKWIEQPLSFEMEAGQESHLSTGDATLLASKVKIWASSDSNRRWNKHKDSEVVLVPRPYQAAEPATFTYTFR